MMGGLLSSQQPAPPQWVLRRQADFSLLQFIGQQGQGTRSGEQSVPEAVSNFVSNLTPSVGLEGMS